MKNGITMIGLGPMGKNLALNLQRNGIAVTGFASSQETRDKVKAEGIPVFDSLKQASEVPGQKAFWVMVPDKAVDSVLEELGQYLSKGDIIIEGGNSHFKDTDRRVKWANERGFTFIGTGVSGGEEGALKGPCIMPGGDKAAYDIVAPILSAVAAKVHGEPCVAYIGPRGAGHFVKMVHNGIEYAMMQAIAEVYELLRLTHTHEQIHEYFLAWRKGRLGGFLTEVAEESLAAVDKKTDKHLLDVIKDTAGNKGTGKWTSQAAYDLGVPLHSISAALLARFISARKADRKTISNVYTHKHAVPGCTEKQAEAALYSAYVIAYAQGCDLLREGSKEFGYELDMQSISRIWRGGCIIRSELLIKINNAYSEQPELQHLFLDPVISKELQTATESLRVFVAQSALSATASPAMSMSLAYFDGFTKERMDGAALIQSMRDLFGAHTYERLDEPGIFHTLWSGDMSEVKK